MAKQGEAVGVEGQGEAVEGEKTAEVLKVIPSGVGGHESGAHKLSGMIVESEEEGLLVLGRPPLVDGGVVLPEFTQAGALPAAAGFDGRF